MFFHLYFEVKTEMSAITPEKKVTVVEENSHPGASCVPEKKSARTVVPQFIRVRDELLADSDSDVEGSDVAEESKKDAKIPACCVCTELPYDPQSLSCGHSLCIICYETMVLKTSKSIKCPLCTKTTESSAVIPNFALREVLLLCWEGKYRLRELLDLEERKKRTAILNLNRFMDKYGISVPRGKDNNPRLLLKILMCLENNPDKTRIPVGLELLARTRKFLYISTPSSRFELFSKDFYYCIMSRNSYTVCVF